MAPAPAEPARTQPGISLANLNRGRTAYERPPDTCHQADVLRNTAEGIYFALALAKRLTRDGGLRALALTIAPKLR